MYTSNHSIRIIKIIEMANSSTSAAEILDRILDKGIVGSIPDNFCCPPCGRYVIASVETYIKYIEAVALENQCCYNIKASVETFLKFDEAADMIPNFPSQCDNPSFENCYDEMTIKLNFDAYAIDRILDKGIVEQGAIGLNGSGSSYLCILTDFILSAFNLQGDILSTKAEILDRILDKGIVIDCTGDTLVVASVETYIKYIEAVGL